MSNRNRRKHKQTREEFSMAKYEMIKMLLPMYTVLDKDWKKIIKDTDSSFMEEYAFFRATGIDNRTVDGVLDWLYGARLLVGGSEKQRITRIIDALESHIVFQLA